MVEESTIAINVLVTNVEVVHQHAHGEQMDVPVVAAMLIHGMFTTTSSTLLHRLKLNTAIQTNQHQLGYQMMRSKLGLTENLMRPMKLHGTLRQNQATPTMFHQTQSSTALMIHQHILTTIKSGCELISEKHNYLRKF